MHTLITVDYVSDPDFKVQTSLGRSPQYKTLATPLLQNTSSKVD